MGTPDKKILVGGSFLLWGLIIGDIMEPFHLLPVLFYLRSKCLSKGTLLLPSSNSKDNFPDVQAAPIEPYVGLNGFVGGAFILAVTFPITYFAGIPRNIVHKGLQSSSFRLELFLSGIGVL